MTNESAEKHSLALQETEFWGRQGAGCIVFAMDTGRILLSHRSDAVLEPNTWGTFGGAIDDGENPEAAAIREFLEEGGGVQTDDIREVLPSYVFSDAASGFRYHNFIVVTDHEFEPEETWETQGHTWCSPDELPSPLHPGAKAFLSSILASTQLNGLLINSGHKESSQESSVEAFLRALAGVEKGFATESAPCKGHARQGLK